MADLFRNSSPGALTLKQSIELARKRLIERGRQIRQARELAAQGRGDDTEVAHVAPGEYVVPQFMQTPEVLAALRRAAAAHNIPFDTLRIGSGKNHINPNTGAPEFSLYPGDDVLPEVPDLNITTPETVPPNPPPADPGMGAMRIPTPPNDVQINPGLVSPGYAPTSNNSPNGYDPRLVPAREKDLQIPEVKAFMDLISKMEGAGYHTVQGDNSFPMGKLAPDLNQFPASGLPDGQSHSGAYQISKVNYDDLAKQMGLSGFQPQTQALMGAQLLRRANGGIKGNESALEALRRGDYDTALERAKLTWTSLPGGHEPNKNFTPDQARDYYQQQLKLYRPR